MFDFIKRYQRVFTLILAALIIIPLTFFGTYSALSAPMPTDKEAFKALNGSSIKRSDVEDLSLFLATDHEDKLLMGGLFGANFLNDGVITKDFLQTGLGPLLAKENKALLATDLNPKLEMEKKFRPYVHKNADFMNAEAVWDHFIPEKRQFLSLLRASNDPLEDSAFNARVNLFLAERRFPAPTLTRVIRMQEMQNPTISPDNDLLRQDLSLFGYHTTEDWFGKRFTRLIAAFIINAAKVAEERGYQISDTEAFADLLAQSQKSLNEQGANPALQTSNAAEYLQEQLNFMRLDPRRATKLWKQVLLFRRLFNETAGSMFLSPLSFEPFNAYVKEGVAIDLYRLPDFLKFGTFENLQNFEAYLDAVSVRQKSKPLELPSKFLSAQEVLQKYPELVKKTYVLNVTEIPEKTLLETFATKDILNWQLNENNFKALKKELPELATGATKEERLSALNALDPKQKRRLDLFAERALLKNLKEVPQELLNKTPPKMVTVSLNPASNAFPFKGIKNREDFLKRLANNTHLSFFDDENNFLNIDVVEKGKEFEVLTFEEALEQKALQPVLVKQLKNTYKRLQDKTPEAFQNEDQSFKPFEDVKKDVVKEHFKPLLEAIRQEVQTSNLPVFKNSLSNDELATYRFLSFGKDMKDAKERQLNVLSTSPLAKQFDFVKKEITVERAGMGDVVDKQEAFSLPSGAFSKVHSLPNGDIYFFQIKQRGLLETSQIAEQIAKAKALLGDDAKRSLMKQILSQIKEKNTLQPTYFESEKA